MTEDKDVARSWLDALAARGVTVALKNGRLGYHPKSAYSAMSNEERATLREHKAAIINLVKEGIPHATTTHEPAPARKQTPAPAPRVESPAPCAYCYRAPCIGDQHPAFYALHPIEAQQHADERATETMMAYFRKPHSWGY